MNITQDGQIMKLIFTAADLGQVEGRTKFPKIHIHADSSNNQFSSRAMLNTEKATLTNHSNVYEYIPADPLMVEAGDFIGIEQPSEENARLLVTFVQNAGLPEVVHFSNDVILEENILPLVTLELSE